MHTAPYTSPRKMEYLNGLIQTLAGSPPPTSPIDHQPEASTIASSVPLRGVFQTSCCRRHFSKIDCLDLPMHRVENQLVTTKPSAPSAPSHHSHDENRRPFPAGLEDNIQRKLGLKKMGLEVFSFIQARSLENGQFARRWYVHHSPWTCHTKALHYAIIIFS